MAFSYSNNFEVLGHLGAGGFGQVFKVRDKIDDQFYAVKKITNQGQLNKKNTRNFINGYFENITY